MERFKRVDGSSRNQVESVRGPKARAGVIKMWQDHGRLEEAGMTSAGDKPASSMTGDTLMCAAVKGDLNRLSVRLRR